MTMKKLEIYVPTQDLLGRDLDQEKRNKMLTVIKKAFAISTGGYTVQEVTGGYVTEDGQLIEEAVTIVYSYKEIKNDNDAFVAKHELFCLASEILFQLDQESVLTVFDNVPTFHDRQDD